MASSQDVIHTTVLILGGGVSGIAAAKTLAGEGITNFKIIEARDELGGRLRSERFGEEGREVTVELGADRVQGIGDGNRVNPIWTLVKKHSVETRKCDNITMFDQSGKTDFSNTLKEYRDAHSRLILSSEVRVEQGLVDTNANAGYRLIDVAPETPQEMSAEYCAFDSEYGQPPEQTSWIASSWRNRHTFDANFGGFSPENRLAVDKCGFKTIIQKEAKFLTPEQLMLGARVKTIAYSDDGVSVSLVDGTMLKADYALVSFSLGVLQHTDVTWEPKLPAWKAEAICSMNMGTCSKIFMQFPRKFWFDTETAVYADPFRGRFPVWQSLDHDNFFPGSGVLSVTVTGYWSWRTESMSDKKVQKELMDVLHTMYPDMADMPEPTSILVHRWYNDPLTRGSYSNWPAGFFQEHHDNLRATVDDRLWFTGEHCSRKYFGFLHGALDEGQAAGRELAGHIKGTGSAHVRQHVEEVRYDRPYPPVGIKSNRAQEGEWLSSIGSLLGRSLRWLLGASVGVDSA